MPGRVSVQDEIRERARRLAEAAPPLTSWQREQIRMILRGAIPAVPRKAAEHKDDTGSADAA